MVKHLFFNTTLLLGVMIFCFLGNANAQCCAGGSGCSIVGGASTGVLQERQIELNTNFQYINSHKFYKNDKVAPSSSRTFDSFNSAYQYFKLGYGLTDKLTLSIEGGYYYKKEEIGLDKNPATTYQSSGMGDLIIFPQYNILNHTKGNLHHEITIGVGLKIPLGSYNDSIGQIEPFSGKTYYVTKPTAVQLSSGGQDMIFYTYLFRGYTLQNFRIFANGYYIRKGWNPNGEKLGDYASVALFAGKTFFKKLGVTIQARYEWVDRMKVNESVLLYGRPSNYYPEATGYRKFFITPQLSFTYDQFTIFAATDIPLYQSMNTSDFYTQVGTQYQATVGLRYSFFAVKKLKNDPGSDKVYVCPMHPEVTSAGPGRCPKCGMDLELKK
jgi:hypothetical protein